jgi:hypothetical protein
MHKEEHHCIPISIGGVNWLENCVVITREHHKLVHDYLDIPYGLLRRFRKRTNHLLYHDKYYVQELQKLHNAYFARFSMLPEELQIIHLNAMIAVYNRSQVFYECILQVETPKGNTTEQFYAYLSYYHAVLFVEAEILEQKFK